MTRILKSLGLTFLVSTIFALVLRDNFWSVFTITTLIQIILFYFFNTIYEGYIIQKAIKLNTELETEKSKNLITLACPSCNHKQTLEMNLTNFIIYKCDKCSVEIKAEPNVRNYITTDPIYFDK